MLRDGSSLLLLWDIDGTLIKLEAAAPNRHRTAIGLATGGDPPPTVKVWHGATDWQILTALLAETGIPPEKEILDTAVGHLERLTVDDLRQRPAQATPGAVAALKAVGRRRWSNGIVTGNTRNRAWAKLKSAGIPKEFFFGPCFFGDRASSRDAILSAAIRSLGKGGTGPVVVLGDTPSDISASLSVGLVSVGVATGAYDVNSLLESGAHIVVGSLLEDLQQLMKFLERL